MIADPRGAEEDTEDLLLGDWLVGGLRVGLGCRSEDGVDVNIDQRDELRVDRGGRLTKLVEDPVLEEAERRQRHRQPADTVWVPNRDAVPFHSHESQ